MRLSQARAAISKLGSKVVVGVVMEYVMSSMGSESLEDECAKAEAILKLMLETETGCGPKPEVLRNAIGLALSLIHI